MTCCSLPCSVYLTIFAWLGSYKLISSLLWDFTGQSFLLPSLPPTADSHKSWKLPGILTLDAERIPLLLPGWCLSQVCVYYLCLSALGNSHTWQLRSRTCWAAPVLSSCDTASHTSVPAHLGPCRLCPSVLGMCRAASLRVWCREAGKILLILILADREGFSSCKNKTEQ